MAAIRTDFGHGGTGLQPGHGPVTLAGALRDIADDLAELRTKFNAAVVDITAIRTKLVATHAKLDADAGVTDTNYAATNDPAALTTSAAAALLTTKA